MIGQPKLTRKPDTTKRCPKGDSRIKIEAPDAALQELEPARPHTRFTNK